MATTLNAAEVRGHIDDKGVLIVDEPIPLAGPGAVRVLVMLESNGDDEDRLWDTAIARADTWDDLKHPDEDIYTLNDGRPLAP